MEDDPLAHSISTILTYNHNTSRYIHDLLENEVDDVHIALMDLKQKSLNSSSNRTQLYCSLNPRLVTHDIYKLKTDVRETERMSWSRLRLSAHSLAVEEGRWNRRGRGRLPLEERLCRCGNIQTEKHVIEQCAVSTQLRQQYGITTMENFFVNRMDHKTVCHAIHEILNLYA